VSLSSLPLLGLVHVKALVLINASRFAFFSASSEGAQPGGFTAYGLSKSAGNHYFKRLYNEIGKSEGFTIVCYHPVSLP